MGNPLDYSGIAASAAGSFANGVINAIGSERQMKQQKELMDYQASLNERMWNMQNAYNTPRKQRERLKAAGLNPDLMYGNGSAGVQAPLPAGASGAAAPAYNPAPSGVNFASDLAAVAAAKESGMNVSTMEKELQIKEIERQRQEFEFSLRQKYADSQYAAELAQSFANLRLALLSGDEKEKDIAIKQWTEAKEKALSQCQEKQRDLLQKDLDTYDARFKAYQSSVKSQNAANYGSANQSNTQAGVNTQTEESLKLSNWIKRQTSRAERDKILDEYARDHQQYKTEIEKLKNEFQYYEQLNKNNENAAASYLNYLVWYVKENTPDLLGFLFGRLSK